METSAQPGWIVSGHDDAASESRPSSRFLFHLYDARHADRRRAAKIEDRMLLSGGQRDCRESARTVALKIWETTMQLTPRNHQSAETMKELPALDPRVIQNSRTNYLPAR